MHFGQGSPLEFASTSLIARDAGEQDLILHIGRRIELRQEPADVSLIFLEKPLLKVMSCQILVFINEGKIDLSRGKSVPIRVCLTAPLVSGVKHLILALFIDKDLLVRF